MTCLPAAAALAAMLGLSGCAEQARVPSGRAPTFYADLGHSNARVDAEQGRAMISAYRLNAGLSALRLDPALSAAAQREADAMARADRPAQAEAVKMRLRASNVARPEVNLSAGYRTLAAAFSGWRDSPQHDRVMKASAATRMGLATAHAPGSKYQVYWALIVAAD